MVDHYIDIYMVINLNYGYINNYIYINHIYIHKSLLTIINHH